jgi:hypothetical protein
MDTLNELIARAWSRVSVSPLNVAAFAAAVFHPAQADL